MPLCRKSVEKERLKLWVSTKRNNRPKLFIYGERKREKKNFFKVLIYVKSKLETSENEEVRFSHRWPMNSLIGVPSNNFLPLDMGQWAAESVSPIPFSLNSLCRQWSFAGRGLPAATGQRGWSEKRHSGTGAKGPGAEPWPSVRERLENTRGTKEEFQYALS